MEDFYVLPTIYVTRQSTPRSSSVKNFASKYCGTRSGILENKDYSMEVRKSFYCANIDAFHFLNCIFIVKPK